VSFAAITLCVASQRVFIVVSVYFVIYPVRKLLDTPSYLHVKPSLTTKIRIKSYEFVTLFVVHMQVVGPMGCTGLAKYSDILEYWNNSI
jgi:hypothetical protein